MNIDTSKWMTQQALAAKLGVRVSTVHNWVWRKKIETRPIPGSRLVLVNPKTLEFNPNHHKTKELLDKLKNL